MVKNDIQLRDEINIHKHLINTPNDTYTVCGIALDNLFGGWTIPIINNMTTKDKNKVTRQECLDILSKESYS